VHDDVFAAANAHRNGVQSAIYRWEPALIGFDPESGM
jgi:hypothetical protein